MANVIHSAMTDPYLHEPKGAAAATVDEVYIADGSAAGSFKHTSSVYGNISSKDTDSVTIATIGTTQKKLAAFTTDGPSNLVTAGAATDILTVTIAGDYFVSFTISFSTTAVGDAGDYKFYIAVDDVASNFEVEREMSGSTDIGSAAASGILTLTAAQTVSIRVESDEAGDSDDIDVEAISLTLMLLKEA